MRAVPSSTNPITPQQRDLTQHTQTAASDQFVRPVLDKNKMGRVKVLSEHLSENLKHPYHIRKPRVSRFGLLVSGLPKIRLPLMKPFTFFATWMVASFGSVYTGILAAAGVAIGIAFPPLLAEGAACLILGTIATGL